MKEINLDTWEQFEPELKKLSDEYISAQNGANYSKSPFVYRGVANSDLKLTTTLERHSSNEMSFFEYYNLISSIKPQVESFTGKKWTLPKRHDFLEASKKYDHLFMSSIWGMDGYSYMIYLRHHGFPSPLLDWTRSPYIAAYFAFKATQRPESEKVSIYVFCEYFGIGKIFSNNTPRISVCGPYVSTHKRHFLQQGDYTICHQYKNDEWIYVPHENIFEQNSKTQDVLWKFTLPWTERTKVLKLLDNYNLNAFSLFDSEEALMETVALRELTFRY